MFGNVSANQISPLITSMQFIKIWKYIFKHDLLMVLLGTELYSAFC